MPEDVEVAPGGRRMSDAHLKIADYPLSEKRREIVRGKRGKGLDEITLDALLQDRVTIEDLRITDAALRQQAEIARAAGRGTLAANPWSCSAGDPIACSNSQHSLGDELDWLEAEARRRRRWSSTWPDTRPS